MALYRAKADGRGTFCFFRDEMAQTVEARRILELDLRKALANEEFELFYQPLVNLKSGRISTCEALLRWNHPVRGTVSPIDIIPVAEDMGLIVDLGRWILRKACMECMKWPEARQRRGQFLAAAIPSARRAERGSLRARGLRPARRIVSRSRSPNRRLLRNTQLTHDVLSQLRRARRADFAGRFRHRLFEPELSAQLPAAEGEDRPLLPRRHRYRSSADAAARRGAAQSPISACRSWSKASKPTSNSN